MHAGSRELDPKETEVREACQLLKRIVELLQKEGQWNTDRSVRLCADLLFMRDLVADAVVAFHAWGNFAKINQYLFGRRPKWVEKVMLETKNILEADIYKDPLRTYLVNLVGGPLRHQTK